MFLQSDWSIHQIALLRIGSAQISSEAKWTIDRLLKFFFGFGVSVFLSCWGLQQLCLAKFKHATWIRTCRKSPELVSKLHTEHSFRKVVGLNRK